MAEERRVDAEAFLELLRNAVYRDNARMITTDQSNQEIILMLEHCDDPECPEIIRYRGPDPIATGYIDYMHFLGKVEKISGLREVVRSYIFDRLHR